jgi:hypothetical protein
MQKYFGYFLLFRKIDHTGRNGTERDGTGRNGTERDGTGRNGTERDGTGRNGTPLSSPRGALERNQ